MAAATWTSTSGSWSSSSSWTSLPSGETGFYPGYASTNDAVQIGAATNVNDVVTENVPSLTIGSLTINGGATKGSTVQLDGSSLTTGSLTLTGSKSLIDETGVLSVSGAITGSGVIYAGNAQTGTLELTGTGSITVSTILEIAGSSTLEFDLGGSATTSSVAFTNTNETLDLVTNLTMTVAETIANSGTIQLAGGSLTDSNGLTVGSTSILTGNGTVTGAITMTGGTITPTSGGLALTSITGFGTVNGAPSVGSAITASNGTLDLASGGIAASASQTFDIANSSTLAVLQLDGTVGSGDTFAFAGSTGGIKFTASSGGVTGTVSGMNVGTSATSPTTNYIDFANESSVSLTGGNAFTGSSATLNLSNGSTLTLNGITDTPGGTWYVDAVTVGGGTEIFLSNVVCYAAGTRILTSSGEVAVEDLAEGDMVVTLTGDARGTENVRWIGYRKVNIAAHPRPELVAPVRIRRDAFGPNRPRRDLLVSPDHAIYVDDKLVVARLLINGMTITQELATATIEYYHVELPKHAILLAEGLPAESYLDTGNRAMFANAGLALVLHPDFGASHGVRSWETDACAPLATERTEVEPMWRRLAERAESMGYATPRFTTTTESDLHLVVDGKRLRPVSTQAGHYIFVLPRRVASMHLRSRASAPTDIAPYSEDRRRLGVAVNRLIVRIGDEKSEIPVDHPTLSCGWHAVEREGHELRRWTNGEAYLPIQFEGGCDLAMLEVCTCGTVTYRLDEAAADADRRSTAAVDGRLAA